jgi:RimJ/RimL family protein N-acetyltransferase
MWFVLRPKVDFNTRQIPIWLASSDVELIEIRSDRHYSEVLAIALEEQKTNPMRGATVDFIEWMFNQGRRSAELGNGSWWLLKYKGEAVATCGLFFSADGKIGRFREVTTHPNWWQRGFATFLRGTIAQRCFDNNQAQQVVIVSEPESNADRIYGKLGFEARSLQVALIADLAK